MEIGRRTVLQIGALAGLGLMVKAMDFSSVLATTNNEPGDIVKVVKTDEEWKALLTPEQYYVLREEGTERPFTNGYHASKAKGTYSCAGCDLALFSSEVKYNSQTGWPSFWQPLSDRVVGTKNRLKLIYRQGPWCTARAVTAPWVKFSNAVLPADRPAVLHHSPRCSFSRMRKGQKAFVKS